MRFRALILWPLLLCLLLTSGLSESAPVQESMGLDWQENDPWPFAIRNGDRTEHRIAITMDDCYEFEYVRDAWELVSSYGGSMTFTPWVNSLRRTSSPRRTRTRSPNTVRRCWTPQAGPGTAIRSSL